MGCRVAVVAILALGVALANSFSSAPAWAPLAGARRGSLAPREASSFRGVESRGSRYTVQEPQGIGKAWEERAAAKIRRRKESHLRRGRPRREQRLPFITADKVIPPSVLSGLDSRALLRAALISARAQACLRAVALCRRAVDLSVRGGSTGVGVSPTRPLVVEKTHNQLLAALGDAGRLDLMLLVYRILQEAEVKLTVVTYCTVISRAGSARRLDMAIRVWHDMKRDGIRADVPAYNALLNAYAKAGAAREALNALDVMRRAGFSPNAISYNSVIDACGRAGDVKAAHAVVQEMQAEGIPPNQRTFSILIHACARQGKMQAAFDLLDEMQSRGLPPNEVTYGSLIDACGRAGHIQAAFGVLKEMERQGFTPNVIVWTTLIDACVKLAARAPPVAEPLDASAPPQSSPAGQAQQVLAEELDNSDGKMGGREGRSSGGAGLPTAAGDGEQAATHPNMLSRSQGMRYTLLLFQAMLEAGVRPNRVTCTALLDGCLKCGELDVAFELVAFMRHSGLSPSRVTFTALLDECARLGRAGDAATLLRLMTQDDLSHAVASDEAQLLQYQLLRSPARTAGPASGNVPPSPSSSVSPSANTSTTVSRTSMSTSRMPESLGDTLVELFAEANQVEDAFVVVRQMIQEHQIPDERALQATFSAVNTVRRLDEALDLLDQLRSLGFKVNEVTYAALLGACGRMHRMMKAYELFSNAREELSDEKERDGLFYSLMEACRAAGDSNAALKVFEEMTEAGVSPSVQAYTSMLSALSKDNARRAKELRAAAAETNASLSLTRLQDAHADHARSHPSAQGLGLFLRDVGAVKPPRSSFPPRNTGTSSSSASGPSAPQPLSSPPPSPELDLRLRQSATSPEQVSARDNLFRVFLVFQEMKAEGLEPDCAAYNALIKACVRANDLERAYTVMREMREEGVEPDVITFTSLIKGHGMNDQIDAAEELFLQMQQRTNHFSSLILPSEHTFVALMRGNLKAGRPARTLTLFAEMTRKHNTTILPGLQSYYCVLRACEALGDANRALAVYEKMRRAGIRLDNPSLLSLVRVLDRNGMTERSARIRAQRSQFVS